MPSAFLMATSYAPLACVFASAMLLSSTLASIFALSVAASFCASATSFAALLCAAAVSWATASGDLALLQAASKAIQRIPAAVNSLLCIVSPEKVRDISSTPARNGMVDRPSRDRLARIALPVGKVPPFELVRSHGAFFLQVIA